MTKIEPQSLPDTSRRDVLLGSLGAAVAATVPAAVLADQPRATASSFNPSKRTKTMSTVTTKDGVQIFYKDWGHGQPVVFHHGWPLSSDDWDTQMLFFVQQGSASARMWATS